MDRNNHINRSGFPLQIGIAHAVHETQEDHGWRVLYQEHGWKHADSGESGFADLILENRPGTVVLNIECKRPQDATWQFLLPIPEDKPRHHFKFWATYGNKHNMSHFGWYDSTIEPASYESSFCVTAGQDAKARPMLERIAATGIESTEALAQEELELVKLEEIDSLRIYINIIATTAKLEACRFDPGQINLEKGTIADAQYERVPFIRFRKQLSTQATEITATSWHDGLRSISEAKEKSVLIVEASYITQLLSEFHINRRIGLQLKRQF